MLKNKVAVITGGSRGIGKAIALEYAKNHCDVAFIATSDNESTKKTLDELKSYGINSKFYVCDVKDYDKVNEVSKEILADFGNVDILVNNAGITKDNLFMSLDKDDIDSVIDINLKGTIYMTKAFIRAFVKKKSGVIINISSVVGMMGNTGQANYAASKAGVIGFTKTIAKEYGKRNIRCNAIAPGYIKTDMTSVLSDDKNDEIKKMIPLSRMGDAKDIAGLALFLVSDYASYITGEVIKVDGGMYI